MRKSFLLIIGAFFLVSCLPAGPQSAPIRTAVVPLTSTEVKTRPAALTASPTASLTPPAPTGTVTATQVQATLEQATASLTAAAPGTPASPAFVLSNTAVQPGAGTSSPAASSTANICLPCGNAAASMTARIPATLTMMAMQANQTRVAPTVRAMITRTAEAAVVLSSMSGKDCMQTEPVCFIPNEHFLFKRPIGSNQNASVDRSYRYGSTQHGQREPHHGVEFPNAQGTPVLAAADGLVVFAGDDKKAVLSWVPNFYGNVVVIAHTLPGLDQTVYSLYGHLYQINVKMGQQVNVGDQIGQVGATGAAIGSHLHFEIRSVKNDYRSNRNPELWLAPLPGKGVLTGRIQDSQGKLIDGLINVQRVENGVLLPQPVTALETYVSQENQPVNGDDIWQENFAAGELPAGDYRLTLYFHAAIHELMVKIEPGRLTFVRFVIK